MSLYQCQHCGCCENTALGHYWGADVRRTVNYDWTGMEDRKHKLLCSACGPLKYRSGQATGFGKWHDQFDRVFLPMGMFKTNERGNLAHIETGDENFRAYAIHASDCAVHNAPALPVGPCDCGASQAAEERKS